MFNGNEKNKQIIKLVLRVVVAGYIGFLGGQLIYRRPPGSSPWFMVAAVFFIVVAVAFTVFSIIMFFRERAALTEDLQENADHEVAAADGSSERLSAGLDRDSGREGQSQTRAGGLAEEKKTEGFSIRDIARYQSKEETDAGSDDDGCVD